MLKVCLYLKLFAFYWLNYSIPGCVLVGPLCLVSKLNTYDIKRMASTCLYPVHTCFKLMLYKFQWNELSCICFNNFCLLHHIVSEEVEHLFLAYGIFVVLGPHTVTIINNLYILFVEMFLSYLEILWIHLNLWMSIFRGLGDFCLFMGM